LRTFASAVAVLIGLVMAAVAVPAMWVDRNIVQEEGFVALAAPLGRDPGFQQRLASAAVNSFGSDQIPSPVARLARPILEEAAQSLSGLPGYPEAWTETLRKSHRLSFADPATLPAEMNGVSSLALDVAPLVGLVAERLAAATSLPLEGPEQVLIPIGRPNQRQLVGQVTAYAPMGYAVAVGSALAFVLGLVAARRRWTVLAGAGAGVLILAAVWKLAADAVGGVVDGTSSGNAVADIFKHEFVTASAAGFAQWTLVVAGAGAVLLVVGFVLRVTGQRRRA
jgi:hypothetical protein